jgi:amidohydrolase
MKVFLGRAFKTLSVTLAVGLTMSTAPAPRRGAIPAADVFAATERVSSKVVAWRRDIHQNAELSNRETRTAGVVAAHLRSLGLEVRIGVARTGVVGILRGGRPGPVVALRADMDALPVLEATGLPFASRATGEYQGQTVPVAHACGHDAHVAMLMGAAEVLAGMRARLPGTIVFIFQPAEEGPPPGEEGGAPLMIREGALSNPRPDAIFGIHVRPGAAGEIFYRTGGLMAASDRWEINIKGRQTHGAMPWQGIDIMSMQAAIVQDFNRLAARTVDVNATPTVITVATVHGGVRNNIIPDTVAMSGTLRTFAVPQREALKASMQRTVAAIAQNYGAEATLVFNGGAANGGNPVTANPASLARSIFPALEEAAGPGKVDINSVSTTGAEDFAWYQLETPGVFYFLGISKDGVSAEASPPNHSPFFDINEAALPVGVRSHALTAIRYLESGLRRPG